MKILHLAYSNYLGGASKATNRLHRALIKKGINSIILVDETNNEDHTIINNTSFFSKYLIYLRKFITWPLIKLFKTKNTSNHSISLLPSRWVKYINSSDADLVNLHWVQRETISISDIAKIQKPIVWTIQDMWAFAGAEHYTTDFRWREGYTSKNRVKGEIGFDINYWTWSRKIKHWKSPIKMIAPSNWIAGLIKESQLMKNWDVEIIPNCIDTRIWQPLNKTYARKLLNLPQNVPILLYGAIGGEKDPRKGFNLFVDSLKYIKNNKSFKDIQILVFGQKNSDYKNNIDFPIHNLGTVNDDIHLRTIYSAADLMAIPSRQDNLPNTGLEAGSIGLPVVAFNIGGLSDIILHKYNGYLANPFNTKDFANGLIWVLKQKDNLKLNLKVRRHTINTFSYELIASKYIALYESILANKKYYNE